MNEPHITLTAADMDDPELLAELAAVTGTVMSVAPELDEALLRQQIVAKKREALELKKANNLPAAKNALAEAKRLEACLASAQPALAMPSVPPARAELMSQGAKAGHFKTSNPDNVTLTAADMDDPALLAELAAVAGGDNDDASPVTQQTDTSEEAGLTALLSSMGMATSAEASEKDRGGRATARGISAAQREALQTDTAQALLEAGMSDAEVLEAMGHPLEEAEEEAETTPLPPPKPVETPPPHALAPAPTTETASRVRALKLEALRLKKVGEGAGALAKLKEANALEAGGVEDGSASSPRAPQLPPSKTAMPPPPVANDPVQAAIAAAAEAMIATEEGRDDQSGTADVAEEAARARAAEGAARPSVPGASVASQVVALKRKAISLKAAGDKAGALAKLKEAKALEAGAAAGSCGGDVAAKAVGLVTAPERPTGADIALEIISGRNLVPKDHPRIFGAPSSDPFVKVQLHRPGATERELKVGSTSKQAKTLSPSWNDSFHFSVDAHQLELELVLAVFDKDTFSRDDPMGEVCEARGTAWCSMVQHGAAWCAAWCSMVQRGAQRGAAWCSVVQHDAALCRVVPRGAARCRARQVRFPMQKYLNSDIPLEGWEPVKNCHGCDDASGELNLRLSLTPRYGEVVPAARDRAPSSVC